MKHLGRLFLAVSILISLSSCSSQKNLQSDVKRDIAAAAPFLFRSPPSELNIVDEGDIAAWKQAIDRQLRTWEVRAKARKNFYDETLTAFAPASITRGQVRQSLLTLEELLDHYENPRLLNQIIRANFDFYQMSGKSGAGDVLMTGYYHPLIAGSLKRSDVYTYPLYTMPGNLITVDLSAFSAVLGPDYQGKKRLVGRLEGQKFQPYFDRSAIDLQNRLQGLGLELVYLRSDLDRFFLQIQGSGTVLLPDGKKLPVYYAGQNGHGYVGIGAKLVEDGLLNKDELSMQAIRDLLDHDAELKERYLSLNPSYVFFKKGEGEPRGSGGAELTPNRSFASDKSIFTEGIPAWVHLHRPSFDARGKIKGWVNASQFMLDQDSGGAIKGPGRVDLYLGSGEWAEETAGRLAYYGEVYYLVLKNSSHFLNSPHSS